MSRRITAAITISLACALSAAGAPRVSFVRTIPAPHELPGERVALIYAMGDNDVVRTFVDVFVERANRDRAMQIEDATDRGNHVVGDHPDAQIVRRVRREHPADVYLGVNRFTCESAEHSGDVSAYNVDGERIKRHQVWIDMLCRARIDVLDAMLGRLTAFDVKGEGTSQRVAQLTSEDRKIAAQQAARFAAISAAELVTPRRVRESIELDETAPGFTESIPLLEADRLSELRTRWEASLRDNQSSAALHYDLAAVCEALGDVGSARAQYEAAQRLAPTHQLYRAVFSLFRRRHEAKK
jgi:hypothetical protein